MSSLRVLGLTLLFAIVAVSGCGQGTDMTAAPTIAPISASPFGAGTPAANSKAATDPIKELQAINTPEGVDPALFTQLKDALEKELRAKGATKAVSKPPAEGFGKVTDLTVIAIPDQYMTDYKLRWSYRNDGDYNQDGIVNVADVVPLAQHYGEDASDPNSIAGVVDGNRNGRVGADDITVIARNFMSEVSGYDVRYSYSEYGTFESSGISVGFGEALGDANHRLYFIPKKPIDNDSSSYVHYRVVPVDAALRQGELSNVANQNNTGAKTNISGFVLDSNNQGVEGIGIHVDDVLLATTEEDGSFDVVVSTGYRQIRPISSLYSFAPDSVSLQATENEAVGGVIFRCIPQIEGEWNATRYIHTGYTGSFSLINGHPAYAIAAGGNPGFFIEYHRSQDRYGYRWNVPTPISASSINDMKLLEVDGFPALFYLANSDSFDIFYTRALDPDGLAWTTPVHIYTSDTHAWSACVVNGLPAIAFISSGFLNYARAVDVNGEQWFIEDQIEPITSAYTILDLAEIGGQPAIAYQEPESSSHDPDTDHLHYITRPSGQVTGWSGAESFAVHGNSYGDRPTVRLIEVGGLPVIGFTEGYNRIQINEMANPGENGWSGFEYIQPDVSVRTFLLADFGGNLAICCRPTPGSYQEILLREDGIWKSKRILYSGILQGFYFRDSNPLISLESDNRDNIILWAE